MAGGGYILANIGTYEKVLLPPGIWTIEFSVDGEDCELFHKGVGKQTHEVPIGQYLENMLYETAGGDVVVQMLGDNGMPRGNTDFESQPSRHRPIRMKLALPKSQATMNFAGSVFFYPRGIEKGHVELD